MSSANNATKPTTPKSQPHNPSAGHRKTAAPATRTPDQSAAAAAAAAAALKCPRCDSPNTKFCYYNNYSLTQPRHFCKTCRRYWTKGGALRNVPVGGGCRKNKKLKPCAASSSKDSLIAAANSSSPFGATQPGGGGFMNLKLFHGISPPAMDFQLGGLQSISTNNNGTSLSSSANLMGGFDYDHHHHHHHPLSLASAHGGLASSIESLSSINQDLHWKLQQQRLAMLFGHGTPSAIGGQYGSTATNTATTNPPRSHHHHQTVPILFQNLEISKPNDDLQARKEQVVIGSDQAAANNTMEWFFGINSFNGNINNNGQNLAHHHDVNSVQTPTSSGSNGNENMTSATNWSNVNGVQAWTNSTADLHQFSAALP